MKCRTCGEELPERARFCPFCGSRVDREGAAGPAGYGDDAASAEEEAAGGLDGVPSVEADPTGALAAERDDDATVPAAPLGAEPLAGAHMPAPRRLEEPLDAVGVGAVPMVPLAPPPRATRIGAARAGRAHAAHVAGAAQQRAFYEERHAAGRRGEWDEPWPPREGRRHEQAAEARRGEPAREAAGAADDAPASERPSVTERATSAARAVRDRIPGGEALTRRRVTIGVGVVAAVLVVAFLGSVATSWLSPFAPAAEPAPQVQPPSDGSIAPLGASDGADDGADDAPTVPDDAPEVRTAVDDYSWTELAQISDLIAAADSDADGLEIAETYHLCDKDGELDGTQEKTLELTDGTEVTMRVAGFRQDERADGSGVAGITLISEDAACQQPMNARGDTGEPYEDSTLRTYLNEDLLDELPDDLADVIVEVSKTCNPVAGTSSAQTKVDDAIWVPSYSELVGPLGSGSPRMGAYKSEGEQYQLFSDLGITWSAGGSQVALPGSYWWLRSPEATNARWFMCVSPDGVTSYGNRPGTVNSVIIGFCL